MDTLQKQDIVRRLQSASGEPVNGYTTSVTIKGLVSVAAGEGGESVHAELAADALVRTHGVLPRQMHLHCCIV